MKRVSKAIPEWHKAETLKRLKSAKPEDFIPWSKVKKSMKRKESIMEVLRDIRDKISLDTMDMSFEEQQEYFRKRREEFEKKQSKVKRKYKTVRESSLAVAEPRTKYRKK